MTSSFKLTPQVTEDLDAIWWFIAEENRDDADRGDRNRRKLSPLGETSSDGNKAARRNTSAGALLDRHEIPNYVIVYRPEITPLQVVAVLHGRRNIEAVLEKRQSELVRTVPAGQLK